MREVPGSIPGLPQLFISLFNLINSLTEPFRCFLHQSCVFPLTCFERVFLVDDDFVSHKLEVPCCVGLWVNGRYLSAFLVDQDFEPVFKSLVEVKFLKVVDDSKVVNESTALADKRVSGFVKLALNYYY